MDFTNKLDKNAAFGAFGKIDDTETKKEEKFEEKIEAAKPAEPALEPVVETAKPAEPVLEPVAEEVKPAEPVQEKRSSFAEGLPAWDLVPPTSVIGRR